MKRDGEIEKPGHSTLAQGSEGVTGTLQLSNEDKYIKHNEQNNNIGSISAICNDGIWAEIVGGVV